MKKTPWNIDKWRIEFSGKGNWIRNCFNMFLILTIINRIIVTNQLFSQIVNKMCEIERNGFRSIKQRFSWMFSALCGIEWLKTLSIHFDFDWKQTNSKVNYHYLKRTHDFSHHFSIWICLSSLTWNAQKWLRYIRKRDAVE